MMKNPLLALMVPALLFSSGQIWAKNGFYMGMDLGIAVAPGMDVESWDNDVATQCDGFINNDGAGNFLVPPRKDCTQSTRDAFRETLSPGFNSLMGALAFWPGWPLGIAWRD